MYLLNESRWFSEISAGAFDVTVQPLWTLYANHFARNDAIPDGPPGAAIAVRKMMLSDTLVALGRPGTVVAHTATIANGLSIALAVAPPERADDILQAGGGEMAYLIDAGNRITTMHG